MGLKPELISQWVVPVLVAMMVALLGWISKIDDRQFHQKDTYATKVELQAAIEGMEKTVANSFSAMERQRAEDQREYQRDQTRMWAFFEKVEKEIDRGQKK